MKKTLIVRCPQPRNPFVAPSLRRMAGSHRRGEASQRQTAARRMRDELKDLHPPSR